MKYKKLIISILVFLSIFLIYVFANDKRMNYIALGDSLAAGQNPYGQISYGYADYISNYLKNHVHGDDIIVSLGAGTITNLSKYLI